MENVIKLQDEVQQDPFHRYRSWNLCFNTFGNTKNHNNREYLALHLGFYLASWGMYRGSSGLLQKSVDVHRGTVPIILRYMDELRCTYEHQISAADIPKIKNLISELEEHYSSEEFTFSLKGKNPKPIRPSATLVSKIMLGTLACSPAYDQFFVKGVREKGLGFKSLSNPSLKALFEFSENQENAERIRKTQLKITEQYEIEYPVFKIIDMHFWKIGYDLPKD